MQYFCQQEVAVPPVSSRLKISDNSTTRKGRRSMSIIFAINRFEGVPAQVNNLLRDPAVQSAIDKARRYLGL